jgi:transcriptional regulator with XRE-family HTH domain
MGTPREDLAAKLRESRIAAGYETQSALARALNRSRPVISKAENPQADLPNKDLLIAWASVTGTPLDELTELDHRARSGIPEWFMSYKRAEAEAHTLRCWQPTVFPGLLQCESYARTLFDRGGYPVSRIGELVAARMERQEVIGQAHLTAIIDDMVLRRCVGSPAVMAEQCAYVASMTERREITLHVVPEGTNLGTGGGLDIAASNQGTTVCLATGLDDVTSTAPDAIARAMQTFERLLGAAVPGAESLTIVRTAEQTWKQRI